MRNLKISISLEKTVILLTLSSFAAVLSSISPLYNASLTEQDAIRISRNSQLVQSFLEITDYPAFGASLSYLNKTQSGRDHGAWSVKWYFHLAGSEVGTWQRVTHWIDESTGDIYREETGTESN